VNPAERKLNRSEQGDLGEASAIEWLTSAGATVLLPLGHSRDYDVVADANGRLLKVRVKTSTQVSTTARGHRRYVVALATRGGNQSWNGTAKPLDPDRADYLFALTDGGRRWFIPSGMLEARFAIALGGAKYSEFEIEPGRALRELVYAAGPPPAQAAVSAGCAGSGLDSAADSGEYPSGQRMAAVNRPAQPSQVRLLPPPFRPRPGFPPSKYDRMTGRNGQAVLNQKRRVTLPRQACIGAGLQDGDRVFVRSDGDGRLVLERLDPPIGTG
jgi:hypothetical protein